MQRYTTNISNPDITLNASVTSLAPESYFNGPFSSEREVQRAPAPKRKALHLVSDVRARQKHASGSSTSKLSDKQAWTVVLKELEAAPSSDLTNAERNIFLLEGFIRSVAHDSKYVIHASYVLADLYLSAEMYNEVVTLLRYVSPSLNDKNAFFSPICELLGVAYYEVGCHLDAIKTLSKIDGTYKNYEAVQNVLESAILHHADHVSQQHRDRMWCAEKALFQEVAVKEARANIKEFSAYLAADSNHPLKRVMNKWILGPASETIRLSQDPMHND